jgi:hypothetical protein
VTINSNITVPIELSHTKSKITAMRKSSIGEHQTPRASEISYVSATLSTKSKLNSKLENGTPA